MTQMNVVQGDSGYKLNFTLQDSSGVAIDLTGLTLTFKGQLFNTEIVKFSGAMAIEDATTGKTSYTVQATDFDAEGRYSGEITITYPSGEMLSFVDITLTAAPKLPRE